MKVLILGLGSIGKRHARLLHQYYPEHELFSLRRQSPSLSGLPFVTDLFRWGQVDAIKPDVAFICSPTNYHTIDAIKCAIRRMHLFIEKPLAVHMAGLLSLKHIVKRKKLTAYVAYPFRFHKSILQLKHDLQQASARGFFFQAFTDLFWWGKSSYSFSRQTGGGALYELSHEIDLAQFILGKIISISGEHIKSDKYDFDYYCNLYAIHELGQRSRIVLNIESELEFRGIFYDDEKCSKRRILTYASNEQMYIDQLKYFFDNIGYQNLDNNIFEAAELFEKMINSR